MWGHSVAPKVGDLLSMPGTGNVLAIVGNAGDWAFKPSNLQRYQLTRMTKARGRCQHVYEATALSARIRVGEARLLRSVAS
jgi:hypothetical protein